MVTRTKAPTDLVEALEYYLGERAPGPIPAPATEWIVRYGPFVAAVFLVLMLPALLVALGLGIAMVPFGEPGFTLTLVGALVELALVALLEHLAEARHLAQRLLQVVRGDVGELLQLGVRAGELGRPLFGVGRPLGDPLLEGRVGLDQLPIPGLELGVPGLLLLGLWLAARMAAAEKAVNLLDEHVAGMPGDQGGEGGAR